MENLRKYLVNEFSGLGKYERIIFPSILLFIFILSVIIKDNIIAVISAIFGISYTILAGKGRVLCYYFGLAGTLCYSYISFRNGLFGNLALYMCYYFPMQILGIFKWQKHLKSDSREIIKTKLTVKSRLVYFITALFLTIILAFLLTALEDKNPVPDAVTTVFSVLGMLFTVKRCIEQWYVWIIVNGVSAVMWLQAYFAGSNCFATVLMWRVNNILQIQAIYGIINCLYICKGKQGYN